MIVLILVLLASACSADTREPAPVDPLVFQALETQAEVEIVVVTAFVSFIAYDPQDRVLGDVSSNGLRLTSKRTALELVGLATMDGVTALSKHPDVVSIKLNDSN